ncbi:alpha/beta fold hydrolase [Rathayibacter sp. VKM Ac-2803]|uniref:alpha/beta fold hydrolase n=1 Tax=unclassified Rathayibacter TaxID=2609250 RepID=UPI00135C98F4|nr:MULTISPECIES: alpha/beta hydrolase [unclassified Rathayibacter]MWV51196.1 alpha/beta fold hydrolase [Rathayibacter sp. VKM Ac-2803]MWV57680.1 alpha/beta fold hydrolase [Rathayibacter sp. VKM Ac-2754]
MANHRFELRSGRGIGVSAAGDPIADRLVVFCHPTPGAGGFDPDPLVTGPWGLHLLILDRPGYGASDPVSAAQATVQDRADDLAEYLRRSERTARMVDGARFGSVGVVGWGSGGAFALSLAARHPDLVDRLAIIGTPAPPQAGVLVRPTDAWERREILEGEDSTMIAAGLPDGEPGLDALGVDSDDPVLASHGGLRNRLQRMLGEGWRQGPSGAATDLAALRDGSWADELDRVTASALIVHGDADPVASAEDGRWYRGRLADARTASVDGTGRLAVVREWRRILDHVAPLERGAEDR